MERSRIWASRCRGDSIRRRGRRPFASFGTIEPKRRLNEIDIIPGAATRIQ
jgi:hypothetical protein